MMFYKSIAFRRIDLEIISALIHDGASVLDLGCGDGSLLKKLKDEKDADDIAARLIDAANDAGGKDNVSVVVCRT